MMMLPAVLVQSKSGVVPHRISLGVDGGGERAGGDVELFGFELMYGENGVRLPASTKGGEESDGPSVNVSEYVCPLFVTTVLRGQYVESVNAPPESEPASCAAAADGGE